MWADMPESRLREYRSAQDDPADFDEFWSRTVNSARSHDPDVRLEAQATGLETLEVFDISFRGFDGQRIHGWLRLPQGGRAPTSKLPALVQFNGYGAGRGHALDDLTWASAGFVQLLMDTRGQGSGRTEDPAGSGPSGGGVLSKGISSPDTYYDRRLFTDAVRAVDAVRSLGFVDPDRVAAIGNSQGGGIALAVAGLVPDLSAVLMQAPFLCDFPRATVITDSPPYSEIADYLRARRTDVGTVHSTLSYFDGVNFAKRATAPGYFSAGLMDTICPPSTVFAAYNNYAGKKEITVWPYNGHDAGGADDLSAAINILRSQFSLSGPTVSTKPSANQVITKIEEA
jgi:cephalosporin-C deacetylase